MDCRINASGSSSNNGYISSTSTEATASTSANANINKISKINRQQNKFIDYFVICGLDFDSGLEPDRFSGTI